MKFEEYDDGVWRIMELVSGYIVAHSGIHAGEPTIKGTRVSTWVADRNIDKDWDNYGITELQAFAAYCFEAGRKFAKRSVQKRLNQIVSESWEKYYQEREKKVNET